MILVIDDNVEICDYLTDILEENYYVEAAFSGKEVFERLFVSVPDLIILDVLMPEESGFELIIRIKNDHRFKDVPIIFLTGEGRPEDEVRGLQLGAVDYLTKPILLEVVQARVKVHLEISENRKKIECQNRRHTEIIHILCHDLLNPIGSAFVFLELLQEERLNEKQIKNYLGSSVGLLENAMGLMATVRTLFSLEKENVFLEVEYYNLSEMISESLTVLEGRYEKKNVDLEITNHDDLFVNVERASFINSILNNLFTNVLKFSHGGPKVLVDCCFEENVAVIHFRDFGVGIDQGRIEKVFDVAKGQSSSGTAGETGAGFGMSLVKKFIDLYGGILILAQKQKKNFQMIMERRLL